MKKFFTIASSMLLSALGFVALADEATDPVGTFTVTDPSGEFVTSASYVRMAWKNAQGENAPINIVAPNVKVNVNFNEQTGTVSSGHGISVEGTNLVIVLDSLGFQKRGIGTYTVTIPANYVQNTDNDELNIAHTFSFEVLGSLNGGVVAPAGGEVTTADLTGKNFTLSFGETYDSIRINPTAGSISVTHYNPADTVTTVVNDPTVSNNTISFPFDSIVDNSRITVYVPTNYVLAYRNDSVFVGGGTNVTYQVWNGLPQATVLSGPQFEVFELTPVKVTWGYQTIEPVVADSIPVLFHGWDANQGSITDETAGYFDIIVYPNFTIESSENGTNDILVLDFQNVFEDVVYANNMDPSYEYFNILEGAVQTPDGRINPRQERAIAFKLIPENDIIKLVPSTVLFIADEDEEGTLPFFYDTFFFFYNHENYIINSINANISNITPSWLENKEGDIITLSASDYEYNYAFGLVDPSIGTYYLALDLDDLELTDYEDWTLHLPAGYLSVISPQAYSGYSTEYALPLKTATGDVPGSNPGGGDKPGDEPGDEPGGDNAVDSITVDNTTPTYYNLQGQRIENPEKGGILIQVVNGKATKVIK